MILQGRQVVNVSVILGHPSKRSFNHAIAETVVTTLQDNGHQVRYHDLYEERFNPVLPASEIPKSTDLQPLIKRHCDEIGTAEGVVIIHPNWWGQPPAILKGWIDRVIRPGVAYEFLEDDSGAGVPCGLLKAKTALVFNTSNTPPEREQQVFGDPLDTLWKNCIFGLCGVTDVYRKTFSVVVTSTEMIREVWLQETRELVDRLFGKS
jgi:NAD(P)H dehydrogenase (quinone)